MNDGISWKTVTRIYKFKDPYGDIARARKAGADMDKLIECNRAAFIGVEEVQGNLAQNVGLQLLIEIFTGIDTVSEKYDAANARIGVGSDSTAAGATDGGLLDASAEYTAMDATYPKRTAQKAQFSGTFGDTYAEFAWEEWCVDNGTTALNRKVESKGTKGPSESWTLTVDITFS